MSYYEDLLALHLSQHYPPTLVRMSKFLLMRLKTELDIPYNQEINTFLGTPLEVDEDNDQIHVEMIWKSEKYKRGEYYEWRCHNKT